MFVAADTVTVNIQPGDVGSTKPSSAAMPANWDRINSILGPAGRCKEAIRQRPPQLRSSIDFESICRLLAGAFETQF